MKTFQELLKSAEKSDEFQKEGIIIEFTEDMYSIMKQKKISYKNMAKRLGRLVTEKDVKRILSGDCVFDVALMVQVARALGAKVRVTLERER
jgi:plasmid maintenance system antidote protein VapI